MIRQLHLRQAPRALRVTVTAMLAAALVLSVSAFGDGWYPIGSGSGRVPPGTYTTAGAADCYWEITDSADEILANEYEAEKMRHIVTVTGSDFGFGTVNCGNWTPLSSAPLRADKNAPLPPGTWRVGTDVSGNNRWISTGRSAECYWERMASFRGGVSDDIIDNYFGASPTLAVVSASDKGFYSSGCGTWVRDAQLDAFGKLDGLAAAPSGIRAVGWARDRETEAPISVHIYVDGVARGALTAGVARADVGVHGFDGVVSASAGVHRVCAYGINVGLGLNKQLGCKSVTVVGNPVGRVESLSYSPDGLRISGWTLDPNTVDPIDVHLYVDGTPRAVTLASLPRTDIAGAYPGYGADHGFAATIPIGGGVHNVCAYGINVGAGGNASLGCRRFVVPANPFGRLDTVTARYDRVRVQGWTIDPNILGPIDVHVYVDGAPATSATASTTRTDIAAAYPAFGADHGFDIPDLQLTNGTHSVCVYAINQGPGGNATLGCRTVTTSGNPIGSVEAFVEAPGGVRVSGWAFDPNSTDPIGVHVYVDGALRQELTTGLARSDVEAAVPGAGPSTGYQGAKITTTLGVHQVCVYAINVGNGGNKTLGCRSLNVRTP